MNSDLKTRDLKTNGKINLRCYSIKWEYYHTMFVMFMAMSSLFSANFEQKENLTKMHNIFCTSYEPSTSFCLKFITTDLKYFLITTIISVISLSSCY